MQKTETFISLSTAQATNPQR